MTSIAATRAALVLAALFAGSAAAAAQSAPTPAAPPPDQQSGRLVVERIEEGWLVAPDARAADLDGRVGSLVGGYVGHITDRTWLIGGGGYWLANRDDDFKMAYGGAVIEWLALKNHRVGFGVRTLVGGGTATLPVALGEIVGDATRGQSRNLRFGTRRVVDGNTRVVGARRFLHRRATAERVVQRHPALPGERRRRLSPDRRRTRSRRRPRGRERERVVADWGQVGRVGQVKGR